MKSELLPSAPSLADALRWADSRLSAIEFGRLTAEALLAHVLGLSRAQMLSRLEEPIPPERQMLWQALVERAAGGEPLAYLTGRREFYGLDFSVDRRVLVPRPETEQLVELGLKFLADSASGAGSRRVLDVGTGSGILAVTLAVKWQAAWIVASDVSAGALRVARGNAARHGVLERVVFVQSDLLSAFSPGSCDLLVANLPYIPSADLHALAVFRHEPALALDGGSDGLEPYRRLLAEAPRVMRPGGRMLLEIEDKRGPAAKALAQSVFSVAQVDLHRDLAGLDRVVEIAL